LNDFAISLTVDSQRIVSGDLVDVNPDILALEKRLLLKQFQIYVATLTEDDVRVNRIALIKGENK
jgi:hypothetical protein